MPGPAEKPASASSGADEPPSEPDAKAPDYERPSLGDLDLREGRRQSIRRRLASVRGRGSSDPATPTLFDQEPGEGSTSGSGAPAEEDGGEGPAGNRPLARVGAGIGAAGAAIASAARSAGGVARDGADRVSDAWSGLELTTRRRIAAVAILVALVAFIVLVIAPLAPCWAPGGDRCAPDDDAIALVPADAAAYVHMNLDPDTDQAEAAGPVTDKLPELTAQASSLLALATDRVIDYRRDIAPWSGGELALSLDAGISSVDRTLLVEVADTEGAEQFVDNYLREGVTDTDVEGIKVRTDRAGTSAAIAGGFLILGSEDSVTATVELARGAGGETLAGDDAFEGIEGQLPDERILDAWIAPALARTMFSGPRADFRPFNTFVNADATQGVGAALTFEDDTIGLTIRSAQDPDGPKAEQDFFTNLPPFEPTLADGIGADALAYLGIGDPAASAEALIERAADTAPDLFSGLKAFNRRLGKKDGVDLQGDLLPTLDGETALTVEPEEKPGEGPKQSGSPGTLAPATTPYLAMLATGADVEAALTDLAGLQAPIAAGVDPGSSGQAPVFESSEIAGVEAQSLQISPVVDLTYAGWDDELVIGTSPLAVERARSDADSLADLDAYEETTEPFGDSVSMLVYLNTRSLLTLGERLFLGADPTYARVAPDLRTLEAIALGVESSDSELSTDLRVAVGEPVVADTEPAPIGAGPG
jgi:hypothetical protein